jgi:hypothetical protein
LEAEADPSGGFFDLRRRAGAVGGGGLGEQLVEGLEGRDHGGPELRQVGEGDRGEPGDDRRGSDEAAAPAGGRARRQGEGRGGGHEGLPEADTKVSTSAVRRTEKGARLLPLARGVGSEPMAARKKGNGNGHAPATTVEVVDLLREMRDELKGNTDALRQVVGAVRTLTERIDAMAEDVHAIQADVASIKNEIGGVRSEARAELADVREKLEELEKARAAHEARLARLEKAG